MHAETVMHNMEPRTLTPTAIQRAGSRVGAEAVFVACVSRLDVPSFTCLQRRLKYEGWSMSHAMYLRSFAGYMQ